MSLQRVVTAGVLMGAIAVTILFWTSSGAVDEAEPVAASPPTAPRSIAPRRSERVVLEGRRTGRPVDPRARVGAGTGAPVRAASVKTERPEETHAAFEEGRRRFLLYVQGATGETVASASVEWSNGGWGEDTAQVRLGVAELVIAERARKIVVRVARPMDAEGRPLNLRGTGYEHVDATGSGATVVLEAGREVRGWVVDPGGRRLAGISVSTRGGEATTGEDGGFRLVGLEDGPSVCRFDSEASWIPRTLELDPGEHTVELQRGGALTGTVLLAGNPVAGAEVRLVRAGVDRTDAPWSPTAEDGAYRFERVPLGRWDVEVIGQGIPPRTVYDVFVDEGPAEGRPLDIRVDRGETIEGRVVDHLGEPVAKGTVWAEPIDGTPGHRVPGALGADGNTFELRGLSRGRYRLMMHPNQALPRGIAHVVVDVPARGRLVLRGAPP